MPSLSISQKISVTILVGALFAVLTMSTFTYYTTRDLLERSIAQQQLGVAEQMVDTIDRYLYERQQDIILMANEIHTEWYLSDTYLPEKTSKEQKDEWLRLAEDELGEMIELSGPWEEVSVVDTKGNAIYTTTPDHHATHLDTVHEQAVENALKGNAYVSDVFLDSKSNKPGLIMAYPIRYMDIPENPIVGVVVAHIDWDALFSILQEVPAASVEMLSAAGYEIADGDSATKTDEAFLIDRRNNEAVKLALRQDTGSGLLEGLADENYNRKTLVSFAREKGYKEYKGLGWIIFIETPEDVAFGAARDAILLIPLFFIPIALLVVVSILFIFRRLIVRPILTLIGVTESFSKGDFSKRAEVRRDDEMGKLAKAFNAMADTLHGLYGNLEKKVDEKTRELNQRVEDAEKLNNIIVDRELKMIELKEEIKRLKGDTT